MTAPVLNKLMPLAGPGNTVAFAGGNFTGSETIYQLGKQGQLAIKTPYKQIGNVGFVRVHDRLPATNAYLFWAKNAGGFSVPQFVGKAQALFLCSTNTGYNSVVAGDTCYLIGYCLAGPSGHVPRIRIYLQGSSTLASEVTPSTVDALGRKVTFTVPALAAGTYDVWVDNGRFVNATGTKNYGRTKCLQQLVVATAATLNLDYTANTQSMGAPSGDATGVTDSATYATKKAALSGHGKIVFTHGQTYKFASDIVIDTGVSLESDTSAHATLTWGSSYSGTNPINDGGNSGQLKNLTIDATPIAGSGSTPVVIVTRAINVTFTCPAPTRATLGWGSGGATPHGFLSGCTFTDGGNPIFGGVPSAYIDSNTFNLGNNDESPIHLNHSDNLVITNNTFADIAQGSNQGLGRQFLCESRLYRCFYDNNTIASPGLNVGNNKAEQFLLHEADAVGSVYADSSALDGNGKVLVNIPDTSLVVVGMLLAVENGPGQWQSGVITAINSATQVLLGDETIYTWPTTLDGTSLLFIGSGAKYVSLTNNVFWGVDGQQTSGGTGFQCDVVASDIYLDSNSVHNLSAISNQFVDEPNSGFAQTNLSLSGATVTGDAGTFTGCKGMPYFLGNNASVQGVYKIKTVSGDGSSCTVVILNLTTGAEGAAPSLSGSSVTGFRLMKTPQLWILHNNFTADKSLQAHRLAISANNAFVNQDINPTLPFPLYGGVIFRNEAPTNIQDGQLELTTRHEDFVCFDHVTLTGTDLGVYYGPVTDHASRQGFKTELTLADSSITGSASGNGYDDLMDGLITLVTDVGTEAISGFAARNLP